MTPKLPERDFAGSAYIPVYVMLPVGALQSSVPHELLYDSAFCWKASFGVDKNGVVVGDCCCYALYFGVTYLHVPFFGDSWVSLI